MASHNEKIGWIGMGRMGFPMAERLLKAGYDVAIWNRTRAKAEPLAAKGGKVVDKLADLAGVDVVFSIVSTGKDLEEVYFGKDGVVIENLIEITLLANKMGVPRHAFLAFINNSVMGSMFTRYKSPALVNLDWTTTFTPELLRKDLDLGLGLGREWDVPMPVTAAAREMLQSHFGAATLKSNPEEYLQEDFAALMETMALAAGMRLASENKNVPTGLES